MPSEAYAQTGSLTGDLANPGPVIKTIARSMGSNTGNRSVILPNTPRNLYCGVLTTLYYKGCLSN